MSKINILKPEKININDIKLCGPIESPDNIFFELCHENLSPLMIVSNFCDVVSLNNDKVVVNITCDKMKSFFDNLEKYVISSLNEKINIKKVFPKGKRISYVSSISEDNKNYKLSLDIIKDGEFRTIFYETSKNKLSSIDEYKKSIDCSVRVIIEFVGVSLNIHDSTIKFVNNVRQMLLKRPKTNRIPYSEMDYSFIDSDSDEPIQPEELEEPEESDQSDESKESEESRNSSYDVSDS